MNTFMPGLEELKVRQKVLLVSVELLQWWATSGTRINVEVVQGLPKTAKFIRNYYDAGRDCVGLVFEDESFEMVPHGRELPHIQVTFRTYHEAVTNGT